MLTIEAVNTILEEAFYAEMSYLENSVGGPYRNTMNRSMKTYRKCKTTQEHGVFTCDSNRYQDGWETVRTKNLVCACVLDEPNHMILIVGSGMMSTNPAVVELVFSEHQIEVTAWAKEGLIKQHTARKAVSAVCSTLELAES